MSGGLQLSSHAIVLFIDTGRLGTEASPQVCWSEEGIAVPSTAHALERGWAGHRATLGARHKPSSARGAAAPL